MKDISRAIWHRLDVDCIKGLPDYSKICYSTYLNLFREFDEQIVKQGGYYDVSYYKEAVCCPYKFWDMLLFHSEFVIRSYDQAINI